MAKVKCPFCQKFFDKEKEKFVKVNSNRYAHAECAINRIEKGNKNSLNIIDPLKFTTCIYCKAPLNKDSDNSIRVRGTSYAHKDCKEKYDKKEKTPAEKLDDYLMDKYDTNFVLPSIKKQVNMFKEKYNYTDSGILRTLEYVKNVKHIEDKKEFGIGIIVYYYNEAYNYYYNLFLAEQKNKGKNIKDFIPEKIEISITNPKRKEYKKRKLFSFLDEEN